MKSAIKIGGTVRAAFLRRRSKPKNIPTKQKEPPQPQQNAAVSIPGGFEDCLGCTYRITQSVKEVWLADTKGNLKRRLRATHPNCEDLVRSKHDGWNLEFGHPTRMQMLFEKQQKSLRQGISLVTRPA
jgi:hypothetical protein